MASRRSWRARSSNICETRRCALGSCFPRSIKLTAHRSRFGPIVLGRYRPRIIVVTTPNYDFHSLFPDPGPGAPPNKNRTPDPTGRTNRIFRDDDHKVRFSPRCKFCTHSRTVRIHRRRVQAMGARAGRSLRVHGHLFRRRQRYVLHSRPRSRCQALRNPMRRLQTSLRQRIRKSTSLTPYFSPRLPLQSTTRHGSSLASSSRLLSRSTF